MISIGINNTDKVAYHQIVDMIQCSFLNVFFPILLWKPQLINKRYSNLFLLLYDPEHYGCAIEYNPGDSSSVFEIARW